MAPSAGFWKGFKKTLLILIVIGAIATALFFILMPGTKGIFFGTISLILVLNLALMLIFTRANDNKRPGMRNNRESKPYDFRKDR